MCSAQTAGEGDLPLLNWFGADKCLIFSSSSPVGQDPAADGWQQSSGNGRVFSALLVSDLPQLPFHFLWVTQVSARAESDPKLPLSG